MAYNNLSSRHNSFGSSSGPPVSPRPKMVHTAVTVAELVINITYTVYLFLLYPQPTGFYVFHQNTLYTPVHAERMRLKSVTYTVGLAAVHIISLHLCLYHIHRLFGELNQMHSTLCHQVTITIILLDLFMFHQL